MPKSFITITHNIKNENSKKRRALKAVSLALLSKFLSLKITSPPNEWHNIPLSSQMPIHFHCSLCALFHSDKTNTILWSNIFGPMVFIYSVIWFRSNVPVSFKVVKNKASIKSSSKHCTKIVSV